LEPKVRRVIYFQTENGNCPFLEWISTLRNPLGKAIIYKRIRQAELGNFGLNKNLGEDIWELKINFGPGYRIYYSFNQDVLIVILNGGTKHSQNRDIQKARAYLKLWKVEKK
jgi:putative addiction module killer protein